MIYPFARGWPLRKNPGRTDPFNGSIQPVRKLNSLSLNPFGNRSVLLDRLDGRYHSSLPKNQCSIPNGLRLSCEWRSPHVKYGKYAGRPTFGILFWEIKKWTIIFCPFSKILNEIQVEKPPKRISYHNAVISDFEELFCYHNFFLIYGKKTI